MPAAGEMVVSLGSILFKMIVETRSEGRKYAAMVDKAHIYVVAWLQYTLGRSKVF